jgi:DNA-binding response OmpR family regulator
MLDEYNLRYVDGGRIIQLTFHETRILAQLIRDKGKYAEYDDLAYSIGYARCDSSIKQSIENRIWQLRSKLHKFIKITAKRGVGYKIKYIA